MKFLMSVFMMLVCSVVVGQTPDPLFTQPTNPPLAPDERFILDHQTPPVSIIDGVPIIGIYDGPGFDPTPDLGIQSYPPLSTDPNYLLDCCERLSRLDWMRNEYDILEEKIYDEYEILDLFLYEGHAPLTSGQAEIVLSTMLRINYLEACLEEYGELIIHQAQIYDVLCTQCEETGP